jgi:hypothetical protein
LRHPAVLREAIPIARDQNLHAVKNRLRVVENASQSQGDKLEALAAVWSQEDAKAGRRLQKSFSDLLRFPSSFFISSSPASRTRHSVDISIVGFGLVQENCCFSVTQLSLCIA